MTREEASVQIEGLKKYCEDMADSDESGAYVFDLDVQALDLALAALRPVSRERVEKVWRGEWREDEFLYRYCSLCDFEFDEPTKSTNFCPACGAPMTDEAVDITLKRLESLHGKENS